MIVLINCINLFTVFNFTGNIEIQIPEPEITSKHLIIVNKYCTELREKFPSISNIDKLGTFTQPGVRPFTEPCTLAGLFMFRLNIFFAMLFIAPVVHNNN